MKKTLALVMAGVMMMLFTACASQAADKVFTEGALSITLTDAFTKESYEGYDFVYQSNKIMVMGVCETQQQFNEVGMTVGTVQEYAKLCMEAHGTDVSLQTADSYVYCEYEEKVQGKDFSYYAAFYNNGDNYWVLSFATLKDDYADQKATIEKFASSVTYN